MIAASWAQALANWAVAATFLGVGLAVAAYFNGKHIKESAARTNALLEKMQQTLNEALQTQRDIQQSIREGNERLGQILEHMDARAETHHQEILKKLA